MTTRFDIQARRQTRHDGTVVHDETRHATTTTLDDAKRTARTLAAEGFTVWIFQVEPGDGTRPHYRTVHTVHPAGTTTPTNTPPGRDRPRTPRCTRDTAA